MSLITSPQYNLDIAEFIASEPTFSAIKNRSLSRFVEYYKSNRQFHLLDIMYHLAKPIYAATKGNLEFITDEMIDQSYSTLADRIQAQARQLGEPADYAQPPTQLGR